MSIVVKLKHSSVQDKAPTAGDLTDGELALNVNANSPAAYIKDSAGNIVKLAGSGAVGADDKWTRTGTELAPTNAGDDVFTSGDVKIGNTTADPNISLNADVGSATFANNVTIANPDISNAEAVGSALYSGLIQVKRESTVDEYKFVFQGYKGTDNTSKIYANGGAEFAGKATTASTEASDPGTTVVTKDYLEGNTGGSGGQGFVEVAGDNMTGNLTLGTNKITLDATDGSAEFAGTVQSNGPNRSFLAKRPDYIDGTTEYGYTFSVIDCLDSADKRTFRIAADGSIFGGSSGGVNVDHAQSNYSLNSNGSAVLTGDVKIGGTLPSAPNIHLEADGSAEFAGGNISLNADGSAVLYRESAAVNHNLLALQSDFGSTQNTVAQFLSNGNALLTGNMLIGGTLPSAPNIELNADGTATFGTEDSRVVLNRTSDNRSLFLYKDTTPFSSTVLADSAPLFIFNDGRADGAFASISFNAKNTATTTTTGEISYISESANGKGSFSFQTSTDTTGGALELLRLNSDGSARFANGSLTIRDDGKLTTGFSTVIQGEEISVLQFRTANTSKEWYNNENNGQFAYYDREAGIYSFAIDHATQSVYIGTEVNSGSTSSTERAIILNTDGSATFAGTVTATVVPPSDAKFKDNITPASPQLADVVALGNQLKNFDWNEDAPVNDEIRAQRQLGLIAQEAEKICPSLVKEIGSEEDSYLGISHDALIYKLLGAIAELQAEVETLKNK